MLPVRDLGRQRLDVKISQIVRRAEQREAHRSRKMRFAFAQHILRSFATLAILGFSEIAIPCYAPPATLFRDHAALVKEAKTILIVEAILGSTTSENSCQFRVVSNLKGSKPALIPVDCHLPYAGDWMTHFSAHSEAAFWKQRSGRLGVQSHCTLVPPAFEIGHYYLLLLGITSDSKQFEEITGPFDKWFVFVTKQLSNAIGDT